MVLQPPVILRCAVNRSRSIPSLLVVALAVLLLPGAPVQAQRSDTTIRVNYLGIHVGFGAPTLLNRTVGDIEWCAACNGEGSAYQLDGRVTQILPWQIGLGEHSWIETRIGSIASMARFTSNIYSEQVYDTVAGTSVPQQRRFTVLALGYAFTVEPRAVLRLGDRWRVLAGGWILGRLSFDPFLKISRIDEVLDGDAPSSRITRLGSESTSPAIGFGLTSAIGWVWTTEAGRRWELELGLRLDGYNVLVGAGARAATVELGMMIPLAVTAVSSLPDTGAEEVFVPLDTALAIDPAATLDSAALLPLPPAPHVALLANGVSGATGRVAYVRLHRVHRRLVLPPGGEQIVEGMEAPVLSISHTVDTALRSAPSALTLRLGNETIGSWQGADPPIDLPLRLNRNGFPAVLNAELRIERADGGEGIARDTLLLQLDTTNVDETREDLWLIDVGAKLPGSLTRALRRQGAVSVAPFGSVDPRLYQSIVQRVSDAAGREVELKRNGELQLKDLLTERPARGTYAVVAVRKQ